MFKYFLYFPKTSTFDAFKEHWNGLIQGRIETDYIETDRHYVLELPDVLSIYEIARREAMFFDKEATKPDFISPVNQEI
jgi:hypothetical protein